MAAMGAEVGRIGSLAGAVAHRLEVRIEADAERAFTVGAG